MYFSKVNCFIIDLNARVHRKVFNVSILPLTATKTSQKRPHFHKVLSRLRKSKTTTADFATARALPKAGRIIELRAEGFGEAHLWDGQGEPKLLTEYSMLRHESVHIKILSKSWTKSWEFFAKGIWIGKWDGLCYLCSPSSWHCKNSRFWILSLWLFRKGFKNSK